MNIFNFLNGKIQLFMIELLVFVLLTSTVGIVASVDCKELKDKYTEIYRTGCPYEST